jgi:hypothetical protein
MIKSAPSAISFAQTEVLGLDWIAEQRIREAIERGEFDRLPGAGQPLDLADDPLVPEDLRVAYRILKNAGYAPPQVHTLRQIGDLERWLESAPEGEQRRKALTRLSMLKSQLEARPGAGRMLEDPGYAQRLIAKFDRAAAPSTADDHGRL